MIRMNKLTDYGILVLTHVARDAGQTHNARDLAALTHVPLPTVSKVLKELHKAGLLLSHRGIKGGYQLARSPEQVSISEVVQALEGPIALTECSGDKGGICGLESGCLVRSNWRMISSAIREALDRVTLAALAKPISPAALRVAR